jgi:energy-converting hydrogenase Eha subunit A
VTESISESGTPVTPAAGERNRRAAEGPDPVIGAGITLLGIFIMGTGGARDAHYVFDLGVLTGVLGAATFVLCVALSAMKQRQAEKGGDNQGEG